MVILQFYYQLLFSESFISLYWLLHCIQPFTEKTEKMGSETLTNIMMERGQKNLGNCEEQLKVFDGNLEQVLSWKQRKMQSSESELLIISRNTTSRTQRSVCWHGRISSAKSNPRNLHANWKTSSSTKPGFIRRVWVNWVTEKGLCKLLEVTWVFHFFLNKWIRSTPFYSVHKHGNPN